MADASVTIKGMAELRAQLKELGGKGERKVLRTSLRKAGNLVAKEARKNAKQVARNSKNNRIGKAIAVRVGVWEQGEHARVGIRSRAGARHAHLVERGAAAHNIRAKRRKVLAYQGGGKVYGTRVRHPGMRARPFLKPALEANRDAVNQVFRAELAAQIAKVKAMGKG